MLAYPTGISGAVQQGWERFLAHRAATATTRASDDIALPLVGVVLGYALERAVLLHQREGAPFAGRLGELADDAAQRLDLVGPDVIEEDARDFRERPLVADRFGQTKALRFQQRFTIHGLR